MKNNKLALFNKFTIEKQNWHGTSEIFTKQPHQYESSVIDKLSTKNKLEHLHKQNLAIQQKKASKKLFLCKQLSEKIEVVSEKVRNVNSILKTKAKEEVFMNTAATVIQKNVRGYFVRKKIENVKSK